MPRKKPSDANFAPPVIERRIGLAGAIFVGLGSMIGAGVFSAVAPAAAIAGPYLLLALLFAAGIAALNATSVAWLAALYPASGGAYVYGRERLGRVWGALAGWVFVLGKLSSCAAMGLTFGGYVDAPRRALWAVAAIAVMTAVNYVGVKKTVALTAAIVCVVLATLGLAVFAIWAGGAASLSRISLSSAAITEGPALMAGAASSALTAATATTPFSISPAAVFRAAGILFFAFAGYARIATLGAEVVEPAKTIPRAIFIALSITVAVYLAVTASALAAFDPAILAASSAPLADAVAGSSFASFAWVVRLGAAIASLGVLLSLIAGVSRTTYAMASAHDLPRALAAVHARYQVPHRAILLTGGAAAAIAAAGGLTSAIALSSFFVLIYYAIAHAAAFTLRDRPRLIPIAGLAVCAAVAASVALA